MSKIINSTTITLVLCLYSAIYPVDSISRWFSSTYTDLQVTLRRYGLCVGSLSPLKDGKVSETEYLIYQIKNFLTEANLDNDQLSNVTALMDNLCRTEPNADYPISLNLNVNLYNNTTSGKQNRCNAIDEAMDSMYYVFKKAAQNKTEPLDFSTIQYYTNSSKEASYNLTDLINTSWIKSDVPLDHICKITDGVKQFIQTRFSNQTAQDRLEKPYRQFDTIMDMIDRLLEPLLGLQKRLYWESNNRFEMFYNSMSNQLENLRGGVASGYKSYMQFLTSFYESSNRTTTKQPMNESSIKTLMFNETIPKTMLNETTPKTVFSTTGNSI